MMQIPEIGSSVIFLDTCDSTNAELARISGRPDTMNGTVVLTYEQTAGRGRRGNSWTSSPNKDLTFSFLINKPAIKAEQAFFPIAAAAVACTEYLSNKIPGKRVEIKWPNDILCQRKKICGMLIENTFTGNETQKTIVGIGINLNGTDYENTRFPATSMFLESHIEIPVAESLAELLPYLNRSFTQMFTAPILMMKQYNSMLYGKSEWVPINVGGEVLMAKLESVDALGNPQLRNQNGQLIVARQDEIQFVPSI